jgi:rod shape-determining protein MreC
MVKRYSIIASVVFVAALVLVLAMSPRTTQKAQSTFLDVIAPFLKTGSAVQLRIAKVQKGLETLDQLERENSELKVQNKELKAINETLRDLEAENGKLREALKYRQRSAFKLIPARVIARSASTWWNTVMIDRGFDDGIKSDMSIITEDGLVGKTTTVARNISAVVLISDETCKVAASVEGSREQGIAEGERTSTSARPELGLAFLSKNANLQPGMKVMSSGVGGVFPSGIEIGVVKEFHARDLDGYATLIPAVDLANLEDVFVVDDDHQP